MRLPVLLGLVLLSSWWPAVAKEPIPTTLCEIAKDPARYDGKMVKVRAKVWVGFESATLHDASCQATVWFTYQSETLGREADTMMIEYAPMESWLDHVLPFGLQWRPITYPPLVVVKEDSASKQLESYLSKKYIVKESGRRCSNCPLYDVAATFVGRLDHSVRSYRAYRNRDGDVIRTYGGGFGHLRRWNERLVTASVADVVATPIDPAVYKTER